MATAGRDGDWLGEWVSEYFDAPEVHSEVARDVATASALSIGAAPSVMVGGTVFRAEEMPDDIDTQIEQLLATLTLGQPQASLHVGQGSGWTPPARRRWSRACSVSGPTLSDLRVTAVPHHPADRLHVAGGRSQERLLRVLERVQWQAPPRGRRTTRGRARG